MPQKQDKPGILVAPAPPTAQTPPTAKSPHELQALYRRLDPVVCELIGEFYHSPAFPPTELTEMRCEGVETRLDWELITDVKDVPTTHLRLALTADAIGRPSLTLHYWGFEAAEAARLRLLFAERTGLPVTLHHVMTEAAVQPHS